MKKKKGENEDGLGYGCKEKEDGDVWGGGGDDDELEE
jgi:hypothetical protein